jgi:NAD(P)-dependent dehydrogenase (short-subunit alcohol dehydrogenase family)
VSFPAPGPLLTGRTAIVTGGAAGIGGAISAAFLAHGARVLAVDSDADALGQLAAAGPGTGTERTAPSPGRAKPSGAAERALAAPAGADAADAGRLDTLPLDVTAPDAAERIAAAAPEADVLVNNVGHFLRAPTAFAEESEDAWAAQRAVNLDHVLAVTRAVLPAMIERGRGGSVINLTTVEAFRGIPGHAVYSAYKAAVVAFGRSLALELGPHGIRVNDIAPDVVETPQLPYADWVPEDDRWRWRTWVPLARPGRPDDVAGAALFLASPLSEFVTGTTIHVDGGTRAAGGWYSKDEGGWTNRPLSP